MSKSSIFKAVGITILAIGIVLAFSGCGGDSGGLVGKWENTDIGEKLEFTSDGAFIVDSETEGHLEFTYKIDGDNLVLGMEGLEATTPTPFSVDGDTLTVTDPDKGPTTYDRVK